jgi:hypothetical protein
MPRGRVPTAEGEEASVVVVVLAVVAMSAAGAAARGQLEAVSVAVELASVERASPVEPGISQAELACQE